MYVDLLNSETSALDPCGQSSLVPDQVTGFVPNYFKLLFKIDFSSQEIA